MTPSSINSKSLNTYRKESHMTGEEFAELLGVSVTTLYRIFHGQVSSRAGKQTWFFAAYP